MQYDKPIMELIVLEAEDVVRTSLTDEGGGDHDGTDGPWGN